LTPQRVNFGVDMGPFLGLERSFSFLAKATMETEGLGFDSVWVPDHEVDPLSTLSFLSSVTKNMKLGTCVLIPDHRHPALLAREIATLDNLSEGRLILGLGAGEGKQMFGTPIDRPVARMLETITIIKKLWQHPKVTHHGDFWEIRDHSLECNPLQRPHPPIWIGASGPRMLEITARHANGCFGPQLIPQQYRNWLNRLHRIAGEIGRNPEEIIPAHLPFTSISKDHDLAVKWLEPYVRWFLVWASKPPSSLQQILGYKERWEKEEDVPREAIERCFIVGTPEECTDRIEEFIHNGASYFVLAIRAPDVKNYLESLELYAREVLPHFK